MTQGPIYIDPNPPAIPTQHPADINEINRAAAAREAAHPEWAMARAKAKLAAQMKSQIVLGAAPAGGLCGGVEAPYLRECDQFAPRTAVLYWGMALGLTLVLSLLFVKFFLIYKASKFVGERVSGSEETGKQVGWGAVAFFFLRGLRHHHGHGGHYDHH